MIDFSKNNWQYIYIPAPRERVAKFEEYAKEIRKLFDVVSKNKILLGCKLLQIWTEKIYYVKYFDVYKEFGLERYRYKNCHQDVFYAVCDKFFGLDKKEVQLYMNFADSFVDKEKFEILPAYKDYKWYQLVEMIPLSIEQREAIDPTWNRQKIRDYKKSLTQPKEELKTREENSGSDEIWIGQEDDPALQPEEESEEAYDDELYERELRLLPFGDVVEKAVSSRRLCYELQQRVISLTDQVEYYKGLAIKNIG